MKRLHRSIPVAVAVLACLLFILAIGALGGIERGTMDALAGWGLFLGFGAGGFSLICLAAEIDARQKK